MNLKDLIQGGEQLQKIQSIESDLLKRHKKGSIAGWGAVFSAVVQIAVILADKETFAALKELPSLKVIITTPEFFPAVFMLLGLLFYILYRRTSILFSETKEPFRYTFFIKEIEDVSQSTEERFTLRNKERLKLLHHDLTEYINQRIKRFSVLETPKQESEEQQSLTDARKSSHIFIYGNYAVREDKQNDEWIIHVMPYVRIGPEGSPSTLAQAVRFPLADDTPNVLDTEEYNQLLEKIYSRLTTEIYARIENDIRNKIKLFPTAYLRANALFIEAQDFAGSNTINAFECATRLYIAALQEIESTFVNYVSGFCLKIPLIKRFFINYIHQYARIQLGYARCLIIKNRTEALSGRKGSAVFEIKHNIKPIIENLENYYSSAFFKSGSSAFRNNRKAFTILTFLTFPSDSWPGKILMRNSQSLFHETSLILFQAYVLLSLTETLLSAFISSRKYLDKAKAVYPSLAESDTLFILAEAFLEPNIEKALIFFRQATEKDPASQVAQYFLAYWTEMKYFRSGNIKPESARVVLDEYEKVLRINPGNIAALAAQGYIYWLIHDLSSARRRFQEGCNIKSITGDTFVGHLIYGIARIAVEQGRLNESCELFRQAISSNPNIGAYYSHSDLLNSNSFYDYISPGILSRYREYYEKLNFIDQYGFFPVGKTLNLYSDKLEEKILPEELRKIITDLLSFYAGALSSVSRDKLEKYELTDQLKEELLKKKKEKAGLYEIKADVIDSILLMLKGEGITVNKDLDHNAWIISDNGRQELFMGISGQWLSIGIKCDTEPRILDNALSYVLNDFGNANLNFYDRFGDNKNYKEAIDNYTNAINKYPLNYVARYNKSMALTYKSENDESADLLNDVIANNPFWIEALISKAGMMQKGIRLNRAEKEKENVSGKAVQNQYQTGGQGSGGAGLKDRDITLMSSTKERSGTGNVEVLRLAIEKKDISARPEDLKNIVKEIFKISKLNYLTDGLQLDLFRRQNIDNFLNLKINWHKLDEKDVIALRTYASVLNKTISNDYGDKELFDNLLTVRKIFNFILNNYYPEDFNLSFDKLGIIERLEQYPSYRDNNNEFIDFLFETKATSSVFRALDRKQLPDEIRQLMIDHDRSFTDDDLKVVRSGDNSGYRVSWTGKNDKTGTICLAVKGKRLIGYYSESDFCRKVRDSYIEYWLEQDHTNYKAFTWVQEYPPKDYISLFMRAFKDQEELNPVLINMLGEQILRDKEYEKAIKYYSYFILLGNPRPVYYFNTGKAMSGLGKTEQALANFEKAVELRKEDQDDVWSLEYYYEFLAEANYNLGKAGEFIVKFENSGDLSKEPSEKALVYNRLGIMFYNDKQGAESVRYYNEAIKLDNKKPVFYNNTGLSYALNMQWEAALSNYETAVSLRRCYQEDSRGLDYYYDFLAEANYRLNRTDEFIEKFESSGDLKDEPSKKALIYNRIGILFFNDKKNTEAISYYLKAIDHDAEAIFYSNIGLAYADIGQWENALSYYSKAVDLREKDPYDSRGVDYYYEYLAEAYFKLGRTEEFLKKFESSDDLDNDPAKKAPVYNRIGILYYSSKNENAALDFYRKAILYDSGKAIFHSNLGLAYAALKDWNRALVSYEEAVGLRKNDPNDKWGLDYYYELLAEAYYKTGKIGEFIRNFEDSGDLKKEPVRKASIYNWIGIWFSNDKQDNEAKKYYQKAIEYDAKSPIYQVNLGWVCANSGEWDRAFLYYEKAVELRRDNPADSRGFDYYYEFYAEAAYKTGRINEFIQKFETSGDLDSDLSEKALVYNRIGILFYNDRKSNEAKEFYRKAIDCDDKKPVFRSNMGMVYADLGEWEEAVSYYARAVDLRMDNPDDDYGLDYYNGLLKEALKKRDEK